MTCSKAGTGLDEVADVHSPVALCVRRTKSDFFVSYDAVKGVDSIVRSQSTDVSDTGAESDANIPDDRVWEDPLSNDGCSDGESDRDDGDADLVHKEILSEDGFSDDEFDDEPTHQFDRTRIEAHSANRNINIADNLQYDKPAISVKMVADTSEQLPGHTAWGAAQATPSSSLLGGMMMPTPSNPMMAIPSNPNPSYPVMFVYLLPSISPTQSMSTMPSISPTHSMSPTPPMSPTNTVSPSPSITPTPSISPMPSSKSYTNSLQVPAGSSNKAESVAGTPCNPRARLMSAAALSSVGKAPPGSWAGVDSARASAETELASQNSKAAPSAPSRQTNKQRSTRHMRQSSKQSENTRTTVMLRNLPSYYSRDMLLELLDSLGYATKYDFVHLPSDLIRISCMGFAFVNFRTHETALQFFEDAHHFKDWQQPSSKVLDVSWSDPLQGLAAQIQRYRNATVMHPSVPEQCKPLLFGRNGERISFPTPTIKLRPPRGN